MHVLYYKQNKWSALSSAACGALAPSELLTSPKKVVAILLPKYFLFSRLSSPVQLTEFSLHVVICVAYNNYKTKQKLESI